MRYGLCSVVCQGQTSVESQKTFGVGVSILLIPRFILVYSNNCTTNHLSQTSPYPSTHTLVYQFSTFNPDSWFRP